MNEEMTAAPNFTDVPKLKKGSTHKHAMEQPTQPKGGPPKHTHPVPDPIKGKNRATASDSLEKKLRIFG